MSNEQNTNNKGGRVSLVKVKCPNCGNISDYNEKNKFRPFCSERCQQSDFFSWANEEYMIPEK